MGIFALVSHAKSIGTQKLFSMQAPCPFTSPSQSASKQSSSTVNTILELTESAPSSSKQKYKNENADEHAASDAATEELEKFRTKVVMCFQEEFNDFDRKAESLVAQRFVFDYMPVNNEKRKPLFFLSDIMFYMIFTVL